MRLAFQVGRSAVALALLVVSLLALVPAPTEEMWWVAVMATEWGHLFACLAGLVLLTFLLDSRGQVSLVLASAALGIFLSSGLRAGVLASQLPGQFVEAFGGELAENADILNLWDLVSPRPALVPVDSVVWRTVGNAELSADVYGTGSDRPVVLMVHGGAWRDGGREQLSELAHFLAGTGVAVVSIDYRLAPEHPHPAALDDVTAAVRWIRMNAVEWGFDRDRIVLVGRASGGHLALLSAYRDRPAGLRGVVALYAPTDLRWAWEHPVNTAVLDVWAVLTDYLGGGPELKGEVYQEASPVEHVRPGLVPTLLIHGGRDDVVPVAHSRQLADTLSEEVADHLLIELPWATHACDANIQGPCGQISRWAIARFLASEVGTD